MLRKLSEKLLLPLICAALCQTALAQSEPQQGAGPALTPAPAQTPAPVLPKLAVEMKKATAFFPRFKPADFPPYVKSAFAAFQKADYKKVLTLAQKAPKTVKRPVNPDKVVFLEALALQGLGQHKEALANFKASRRLRGSNSDVYFFEALSQIALGNQDSAIAALNDALWFGRFSVLTPAEVNLYLGNLYKMKGDGKRALSAYSMAGAAKPPLPAVSAELAAIQLESGSRAQAIKTLKEARAFHPADVDLQTGMVNALLYKADRILNADDIEEAGRIAAELLKQPSVKGSVRSKLWPLYLQALIAEGKLDHAERVLNQAKRETTSEERDRLAALADQIKVERSAKAD